MAHNYFNRSVVDVFQHRNVVGMLALEAPVCGRYDHMQGIAPLRQTKRHRARVVQRACVHACVRVRSCALPVCRAYICLCAWWMARWRLEVQRTGQSKRRSTAARLRALA